MKIAIDPGHGMNNAGTGFDSGAEAAGFREADIALDYGLQLQKAFQANQIPVFMTRADNVEKAPVGQRAGRAEKAGCTHYIALHLNDSTDSSAHGLEVLFRDATKDKPLAEKLQTALVKVTKFRDRGTNVRTNLAVLKFSKGPAVLIELGFISNTPDRTDLLSHAVRDGVCDAIVAQLVQKAVPAPLSVPALIAGKPAAPGGSKVFEVRVIADALNVRKTPSLQGTIIGSLNQDDVVDCIDTSDDEKWLKIQKGDLTGWSSHRFLVPLTPDTPPGPLDEIIQIATTSAISRFDWANRGIAPRGYIKGMAVVYARVCCKLQAGDDAAIEMAKANTGDRQSDALAHYAQKFSDAGMSNEADGVDTLRHLFVLLIGLGMRESSGRHCEGRDRSASNTTANTAEAGLFQTSFDAKSASPLMPQLFQQYSDNPSGFVDIFKEGVQCRDRDFENFGSGAGRDFQRLSKECPAFAAEFAGVGLRNIRTHWGPINTRAAEIRPECNTMLLQIQHAVDTSNLCPI